MDLYMLGHLGLFFFKELHTHTHTLPTFVGFSLRCLPLRDSGSMPLWGLDFGHFVHGFFYLEHSDC